jgi:uncharacterized spore protein YtfJ
VDVENLLAKVADNLSVRRAFGTAYEKDGMLIIPVAIVAGGGGGGTGRNRHDDPATGPGRLEEDSTAHEAMPQGSGRTEEGGGFGGLVLPSGAYIVKGDQVRWVPAVDVTVAALVSLSLVRMIARAWNHRHRHRCRP